MHRQHRDEHGQCRARHREQQALDDQLPDDANTRRTDDDTNGNFALARRGAREQQVRDVGAGDEQEERGARGEHEERCSTIADECRLQRPHEERRLRVVVRDRAEMATNRVRMLGRLRDRHVRRQSRDRLRREEVAECVHDVEPEWQRERNPHVGARREAEVRRHDADHAVVARVHVDGPSDDCAVPAELPLPQPVRDDDCSGPMLCEFFRHGHATDRRRTFQRREEIASHVRDGHALRLDAADEVQAAARVHGDVGEYTRVGAEIIELRSLARPALRRLEGNVDLRDGDETVGVRKRERTKEGGVDGAEHRGVGADAECQHGDDRGGEPWRRTEATQSCSARRR